MYKLLSTAVLISTLTLSGCQTTGTPPSTQVVVQEQQRSASLVNELRTNGKLIENRPVNHYINGLVANIGAQRSGNSVPLQTYIIDNANVNAFTTGGGFVFVNSGLIAAMENEAQLALILAHEIAHIDANHLYKSKGANQGINLLGSVISVGLSTAGLGGWGSLAVNTGLSLALNAGSNGFSRGQETAADNIALKYIESAGYDSTEGARSFEVLRRLYGDDNKADNILFSSHPINSDRLNNLQSKSTNAGSGLINQQNYLTQTHNLRVETVIELKKSGRTIEAEQIDKNINQLVQ